MKHCDSNATYRKKRQKKIVKAIENPAVCSQYMSDGNA